MNGSKLLGTILVLSIAIIFVQCAVLKPLREDKLLQSVFRNIISQNKLRGFVIFNMISLKPGVVQLKVEEIFRQAALMTSVTCLTYPTDVIKRFADNTTRFYNSKREMMIKANLASRDSVYTIVNIRWSLETFSNNETWKYPIVHSERQRDKNIHYSSCT